MFLELPCLSFDIIRDKLGEKRFNFPLECYIVGGTQAEKPKDNQLNVISLTNLNGIENKDNDNNNNSDDDDDDKSSDEESDEAKAKLPVFRNVIIPQFGDINRIKVY